jgi:hypothetical protein
MMATRKRNHCAIRLLRGWSNNDEDDNNNPPMECSAVVMVLLLSNDKERDGMTVLLQDTVLPSEATKSLKENWNDWSRGLAFNRQNVRNNKLKCCVPEHNNNWIDWNAFCNKKMNEKNKNKSWSELYQGCRIVFFCYEFENRDGTIG